MLSKPCLGTELYKLLDQQQVNNLLSNLVQQNTANSVYHQSFSSKQCSIFQHEITQQSLVVRSSPPVNLEKTLSVPQSIVSPDQQAQQNASLQPQQQLPPFAQQQFLVQQPVTLQQQTYKYQQHLYQIKMLYKLPLLLYIQHRYRYHFNKMYILVMRTINLFLQMIY